MFLPLARFFPRSGVMLVFAGIGYEIKGKYERRHKDNKEKKQDALKQLVLPAV